MLCFFITNYGLAQLGILAPKSKRLALASLFDRSSVLNALLHISNYVSPDILPILKSRRPAALYQTP
ncbi:MAG TPA: hypothetical protein VK249_28575 [Anaerolineales bacterium]|nr:hypothetical protein [Anaerolineales bacterium]